MSRMSNVCRLTLQPLEDRRTPATGTFVEDFTHDTDGSRGGFDTHRDGVQISRYQQATFGAAFVQTLPAPGAPAGQHSLRLRPVGNSPTAQYLGGVFHTSESGGLAPWEHVRAASVTVRGGGTVTFVGLNEVQFTNTAPPDQWVIFAVTADTLDEFGQPLGPVEAVRVTTGSEMYVDDVTVQVGFDPTVVTTEPNIVRVRVMGNALAVVGDDRNNTVRVEFSYETGDVRVLGLGGTRVVAVNSAVLQVAENEVAVPGFGRPELTNEDGDNDRDVLVNLGRGDDLLRFVGVRPAGGSSEFELDDVVINTGGGDSIVEVEDLSLFDALSIRAGGGPDRISVSGTAILNVLQIATEGGGDEVLVGRPSAAVYEGESPGLLLIGEQGPNPGGQRRWINTGPGRDLVRLAGVTLTNHDVNLGDGADELWIEAARVSGLRVSSGLGDDVVTFRNSRVSGFRLTLADSRDILRLDRVLLPDNLVFAGNRRLVLELPPSGTMVKNEAGDSDLILDPSASPAAWWAILRNFVEDDSEPKVAGVRLAPLEF
jgi:hypothetical protein